MPTIACTLRAAGSALATGLTPPEGGVMPSKMEAPLTTTARTGTDAADAVTATTGKIPAVTTRKLHFDSSFWTVNERAYLVDVPE